MNNQPRDNQAPQIGGRSHVPASSASPEHQRQVANVVREQINTLYDQNPPNQTQQTDNPYDRTHQENFDWREYHSAWQAYYQEYYRRIYQNQPEHTPELATPAQQNVKTLKEDVVKKVKERATKFKKSHHFWPIMSAFLVGLVFLFIQFNSILIAQVKAYVSPGALEGKNLVVTDPSTNITVGPEPRLIIPKINVDIPIDFSVTALDDATVQVALRDAAVHYKLPGADSLPGQYGNVSILGHSSNDVFAAGSQKFAFVLTDHLMPGDTYYIHYNGVRYTYKVTEKRVINPDEVRILQLGYDKPMSTLITCTPPGTALKRLLIFAEQISPDPAAAARPADTSQQTEQQEEIPGNSPTLFQQIWDAIF